MGEMRGRLWFETSGSGKHVRYFCRRRYEELSVEVPDEDVKEKGPDQMSIWTEHGETFDPIS
ncbi:MAG: hypothetical protein CL959_01565 [Euryarchaeota archaeon]|nr:hypothetical protein [Euryarchaeota archaeon]|tara:strand:+ start:1611 stop:1796 length:186 start_codon:yes stop_codon:yes gene_type:complete